MATARTVKGAVVAMAAAALLAACSEVPQSKSATSTAGGAAAPTSTSTSKAPDATATLLAADRSPVGTVTFTAAPGGTEVDVELVGNKAVKAGTFHGIHVHANDDPANGEGCKADPGMPASTWFTAVDGHLKAGTATHLDHTGDLPSVLVGKDGAADLRFTTDRFTPAEVAGKAVVLHANPDNFGNVPIGTLPDQYTANAEAALTKTTGTGNAGDRIACGLITRS